MKSPFTGKEMRAIREFAKLPYRKDEFEVFYHFYQCEDTQERFTDDNLDNININQVYNQYREKYGIPFPEEIKDVREKYEVSAKKMSEVLGLGSNAYRLYESGEMPTVAIGRLILSIKNPEDFKRQVEFSTHILKDTEYVKLIKTTEKLIAIENDTWQQLFNEKSSHKTVDDKTGFKMLDLDKVSHALCYFANNKIDLYKTKVNKLLFYLDFLNYQRAGTSMCGLTYRAISYGPVPVGYEKIFKQFYDNHIIDIEEVPIDYNYAEKFTSLIKFDANLFTESELRVLEDVTRKFYGKNTNEVVNISHEEAAWKDNKDTRSIISYKKYSFNLKAFAY